MQTVDAHAAPELAAVLGELERATGLPIVLNTSFIGAGEPIIANEIDALGSLIGTRTTPSWSATWSSPEVGRGRVANLAHDRAEPAPLRVSAGS